MVPVSRRKAATQLQAAVRRPAAVRKLLVPQHGRHKRTGQMLSLALGIPRVCYELHEPVFEGVSMPDMLGGHRTVAARAGPRRSTWGVLGPVRGA